MRKCTFLGKLCANGTLTRIAPGEMRYTPARPLALRPPTVWEQMDEEAYARDWAGELYDGRPCGRPTHEDDGDAAFDAAREYQYFGGNE